MSYANMPAITISFCLDSERDQDLLDWLQSQGQHSRSALIRAALRRGLPAGRQGLEQGDNLTIQQIRLAVRAELANYALQGSEVSKQSSEPEEAAANLDALEKRLEGWE